VVRSAEQHRPQPEEIAGDLDIDDLPRPAGQNLVGQAQPEART
jgi:hypothetical protein